MVPTGNPKGIKSETDLCGLTISIQSGGLVETRIDEASTTCIDRRQAGDHDPGLPQGRRRAPADRPRPRRRGLGDRHGRRRLPAQEPRQVRDRVHASPARRTYGIYFGKGKADVGTALTAALKALKDDGTLAALATKYNLDPANLDVIQ